MTDFRALCVELTDCLEKADWPHRYKAVFQQWTDIAHAALAEPEPEEPTDEELQEEFGRALLKLPGNSMNATAVAFARAVLARWGNHRAILGSSLQPIPVSERLPGSGDCDAEGRCWLCGKVERDWRLVNPEKSGVPQLKYCFSHWLPAPARAVAAAVLRATADQMGPKRDMPRYLSEATRADWVALDDVRDDLLRLANELKAQ